MITGWLLHGTVVDTIDLYVKKTRTCPVVKEFIIS